MRPGFFLVFAALLAATAPAIAQPREPDGVQPLDRLLPEIRRTHPGEFYDADGPTPGPGGSQHYHLKWMTPDGRVVWYDTDARTGRVLRTAPGRDNFDPGGRQFYGPRAYGGPGDGYRRGGPREYPQGYESRRGYDRSFGERGFGAEGGWGRRFGGGRRGR